MEYVFIHPAIPIDFLCAIRCNALMRTVLLIPLAALALSLSGCGDPYYDSRGHYQGYYDDGYYGGPYISGSVTYRDDDWDDRRHYHRDRHWRGGPPHCPPGHAKKGWC